MPKVIYAEGDTIDIDIKLTNNSTLTVKGIAIDLVQYCSFRNKTQTKVSLSDPEYDHPAFSKGITIRDRNTG